MLAGEPSISGSFVRLWHMRLGLCLLSRIKFATPWLTWFIYAWMPMLMHISDWFCMSPSTAIAQHKASINCRLTRYTVDKFCDRRWLLQHTARSPQIIHWRDCSACHKKGCLALRPTTRQHHATETSCFNRIMWSAAGQWKDNLSKTCTS